VIRTDERVRWHLQAKFKRILGAAAK
jgi:hypothetical protein